MALSTTQIGLSDQIKTIRDNFNSLITEFNDFTFDGSGNLTFGKNLTVPKLIIDTVELDESANKLTISKSISVTGDIEATGDISIDDLTCTTLTLNGLLLDKSGSYLQVAGGVKSVNIVVDDLVISKSGSAVNIAAPTNVVGDFTVSSGNVIVGTGLIGYDGTASKGLEFDSGNEKVTLLSGQFVFPAGTEAAPSIGWTNTGFYEVSGDVIGVTLNGDQKWEFNGDTLVSAEGAGPAILNEIASNTNPIYTKQGDLDTGLGFAGADQLSLISGTLEGVRVTNLSSKITINANGEVQGKVAEDTDSDTDDVLNTGIVANYGLLIVRESTGGECALFRVENQTVIAFSGDIYDGGNFTTTKDNASTYNVYWETDQFKIQNKVGDNKNIKVAFYGAL